MANTTSVAVTKEAKEVLDTVSRTTGLSKLHLASEAIKAFFDPERNPQLSSAIAALDNERSAGAKRFVDEVIAFRSKDVP